MLLSSNLSPSCRGDTPEALTSPGRPVNRWVEGDHAVIRKAPRSDVEALTAYRSNVWRDYADESRRDATNGINDSQERVAIPVAFVVRLFRRKKRTSQRGDLQPHRIRVSCRVMAVWCLPIVVPLYRSGDHKLRWPVNRLRNFRNRRSSLTTEIGM